MEVIENDNKGEHRAMPGATGGILCQFLQELVQTRTRLKSLPYARPGQIQQFKLCYWHARRAIRTKLASTKNTDTQNEYRPSEAQLVIPDLEVC